MIVQLANKRLEKIQMILGIFIFTIFISYSCIDAFHIQPGIIWTAIFLQAIGIVVAMRTMIKNKVTVRPYLAWTAKKSKTIQHNWNIRIISFMLFAILGAVHFLIVHHAGKDLMPYVYDYGIGGIAAIILQFLLGKNWNVGMSDKGIIFGSKFDSKLIEWRSVHSYSEKEGSIIITFDNTSILNSMTLTPEKQQKEILQLIAQSVNS